MEIRAAADEDWPSIYPFYATIMNEGRTYAFPEGQILEEARPNRPGVGPPMMYRRL